MKKLLILMLCITFANCDNEPKHKATGMKNFDIEGKLYALDTILIANEEKMDYFQLPDSLPIQTIGASHTVAHYNYVDRLRSESQINNLMIENSSSFNNPSFASNWKSSIIQSDYLKENNFLYSFLETDCYQNRPRTIRDLTSGLSLRAYDFDRNNQGSLSLFGFFNINLGRREKVVLIEFLQTGKHNCDSTNEVYGVGARMMMRIKSRKNNAKINSPQQVSASVTFGLAEVQFSIKTVGITGPGTSNLINVGALTENTYSDFLKAVSNLIIDVYKAESAFIIDPQLIFSDKPLSQ